MSQNTEGVELKRIWGIQYEELPTGNGFIWRLIIKKPFYHEGKYRIGINEKLIRQAHKRRVERFILTIGQQERQMNVPNKATLKALVKTGGYEDRPSMFKDSPPMRIYHFWVKGEED